MTFGLVTEAQINEIKAAINRATSIEEVNRLEKALKVPVNFSTGTVCVE